MGWLSCCLCHRLHHRLVGHMATKHHKLRASAPAQAAAPYQDSIPAAPISIPRPPHLTNRPTYHPTCLRRVQMSRHARRVYVGGLPVGISEVELTQFFNAILMAAGATATPGSPVLSCYMNPEKRFAFVELRSVEETSNAMAFDNITCRVRPTAPPVLPVCPPSRVCRAGKGGCIHSVLQQQSGEKLRHHHTHPLPSPCECMHCCQAAFCVRCLPGTPARLPGGYACAQSRKPLLIVRAVNRLPPGR